jgi:transcriptional regulator with XRE-family HTH domain
MPTAHERLGFFNARLLQRMNELNLSMGQLAAGVGLTYEQVRKLALGHCLPSNSSLERLCSVLAVSQRDMKQRVARDRMIFKFEDNVWTYWGINPNAGPLYILFPLLAKDRQEIMRLQLTAFVEAKKKRERKRTDRAA